MPDGGRHLTSVFVSNLVCEPEMHLMRERRRSPRTFDTTDEHAGAASCDFCDLGTFGDARGHCTACPGGRYKDDRSAPDCTKCPKDTYFSGNSSTSRGLCAASFRSTAPAVQQFREWLF